MRLKTNEVISRISLLAGLVFLTSCGQEPIVQEVGVHNEGSKENVQLQPVLELIDLQATALNPNRNAYFGDLHVHTEYSFDAYSFGTTATPYDAYRYAKGEAITHPSGYQIQLQSPLDFYAVTDHAMFLGVVKEAADTSTEFSKYKVAELVHNINAADNMGPTSVPKRVKNFAKFIPGALAGIKDGSIDEKVTIDIMKRAWLDTIKAAKQFNDPGNFTTFVAYEYTSRTNERGNLHRNVIFDGDQKLPAVPFSRFNSQNPEGLWDWMDGLRAQGIESLAIPHNSNGSNGAMFALQDWVGDALDVDYAEQRMRNEPLVEITQIKGTSETHPILSPSDEWANFEISPYRVATKVPSKPDGSYVRQAWRNGIDLEDKGQGNPFKFGVIAASDTHVGATSDDESTFFSKAGIMDGDAVSRGSVPPSFLYGSIIKMVDSSLLTEVEGRDYLAASAFDTWAASGIAGVWAEENTRASIYAAFRRKETFATSGPRILVRFFASNDFDDDLLDQADPISAAYRLGVPMGSQLNSSDASPQFFISAISDPNTVPLQRMQIVKGYVENGTTAEKIFDVACSDGLQPDPLTHRCPSNGASVNLSDCSTSSNIGDREMATVWSDPEFNAEQKAFYYVRVLENPTCRWSTWDAIKAGVAPRADLQKTIQERAWTSPIWIN